MFVPPFPCSQATVLTRAIFLEGLRNVSAGINPVEMRKGVQAAVDKVVQFLHDNAKPISTSAEIAQVCAVYADVGNCVVS